jgi:hypothetical protein
MSEVAWREERVRDLQRLVSEAQAALTEDEVNRRWQLLLELRQGALAAAERALDVATQLERYYAVRQFDAAFAEIQAAHTIGVPIAPAPVRYRLVGGRPGTRVLHGGKFYTIGDELDGQKAQDLAKAGWRIEAMPM